MLLLLAACTEYGLQDHTISPAAPADPEDTSAQVEEDDTAPADTEEPAETGGQPVEDTAPDEPDEPVDCTGVDFGAWQWWGSQPFTEEAGPQDDGGDRFYEPDYDMVGWSTISMPERNVPVEQGKAFLARFDLAAVPPDMTLTFASDDGLWLWVNGVEVGHWGGDWLEEGCVNADAGCEALVEADPIDVTEHLVVGSNVIAARVSNAVVGSWFELAAACRE